VESAPLQTESAQSAPLLTASAPLSDALAPAPAASPSASVAPGAAPQKVRYPRKPQGKHLFKVSPKWQEYSSLLGLLAMPVDNVAVCPKRYFQASNELVVITLVVCWTITLIVNPESAINHPARDYVGHFNPCFGWDFAPASYVAVFGCAADVHLAFTYASLEATRTRLRDTDGKTTWAERFAFWTACLHALAAMLWMVLWLVGPPDGRWMTHLGIFSTAVSFRYLCSLGNYVEARFGDAYERGYVTPSQGYFIAIYGLVTASLPVGYLYDVAVYRAEQRVGVDPPLPWWLLQTLDVLWMICLAMSTSMAVPEPPILITRKVLEFGDTFEVCDEEQQSLVRGGLQQLS